MKKYILIMIILSTVLLSGCTKVEEKNLNIVAVNFPSYDFARAITKNSKDVKLEMLVNPGEEVHTFEPTPKDIIGIQKSDIFIYTGGESDNWVEDIIKDIDKNKTIIIKLMDLVELKEEETTEGMEIEEEHEEEEYDEHVWTSLKNSTKIIKQIEEIIEKKDSKNKNLYISNTDKYLSEINQVDQNITEIVNSSKRKELIFGDRFPLRYFTDDYNLKYYAAFPGCAEETEASAKTLKYLIDKVKEDNIPVVFKIEASNGLVANQIAEETKTKVLEFNSAHNISKKEFDSGTTYVDIMKQNAKVLKEALN